MAHLVTGYAGQAHIKSSDDGAFNAAFFGGGQYVMDFGNCFKGSIIDNNTVRILDGDGLMYGRHFRIEPNTYEDMKIENGTAGRRRIDLICMTYEKDAIDETEKAYLQVIKGTETTGTASIPEYVDGNILKGASLNQMPLYKVTINGVVLEKIEAVFELIPSYEGLAKIYADKFEMACEELKNSTGIGNFLTKEEAPDYVVEEGETTNGTYRKWNSGVVEYWGVFSQGILSTAFTSWGSIYYCTPNQLSYPTGLFIEKPEEQISVCDNTGGFWFTLGDKGTKDKVTNILLCCATVPTSNKNVEVHVYAKGSWK